MAKGRTSMKKIDQIRILSERGYSRRAIQRALTVSLPTIHKALGIAKKATPGGAAVLVTWDTSIDWAKVKDELERRGTTVKQLHRELAPEVNYLTFWRAVQRRCPSSPTVSMRLDFKPGEKTQVDFTDGIEVIDGSTGRGRKTQLFVGVLAFSSRVYGEFVWDQKLPNFIAAHERMWHVFGGVTPYVVIDNLKGGVTKADLYDPDLNPTYTEYANHAGFAVMPARPYHPRDKAKVESNINVIQRQFYQEVRDRRFYFLEDLNHVFKEFLGRLNAAPMKEHGVSRLDRFKEEEVKLLPLPATRYEVSEWRKAKVHPDCHVQVEKNFYSVPYAFVGRTVRVRLGERLLEIFDEETAPLTSHARLFGSGKSQTVTAHYPEAKYEVASFHLSQAKAEARLIGPATLALVEELLGGEHPLRHLRRIQGILRLVKTGGIERASLDYAALQAMNHKRLRVGYIKSCALYHQRNGTRPVVAVTPKRDLLDLHLHISGTKGPS